MRSLLSKKFVIFYIFIVMFILHLSLLTLKRVKLNDNPQAVNQPLRVKIIDSSVLEAIRSKQQIVQSENPTSNFKPKESRFLSDRDRSFDRQSRARANSPFSKGEMKNTEIGFLGVRKGETFNKLLKKFNKLKDLKLSELGAFSNKHDPFKSAIKKLDHTATGIKRKISQSTGSSTNDYLNDVPLGEFTHLNTTEYKYYGYYHRIKTKLEQFWSRSIQEKANLLAKNGRSIASSEVITSLRVTMDKDGEIIAIRVLGPSGVRELDDAAIDSFNQAGPFPNPPRGMIVDGKVEIEWGFVVNT